MRYGFKQIQKFTESIVRHPALPPKVMVVGWNELVERHPTLWVVLQQVHHFQCKLFSSFYLLWTLVCVI